MQRVAILTADVGEGHLAAARVLADELRAEGAEVAIVDALDAFGPVIRLVLRDAYRVQLRRAPWIFGLLFWSFMRVRPLRALGRLGLAVFGGRGLRRALLEARPDLVVSTYPAATSVLGSLRRRGVVDVPTCATITDLGGVAFWSHPYIDAHLVMHPAMVDLVEREAGRGSARVIAPLTRAAFRSAPDRTAARLQLGLPAHGRVVLVSGGGWGAGDVVGAAAEAAALPDTTVVCLAGRDARLHARLETAFAADAHVRVLGFTDEMPALLAAADVLVHTTGGVTCLEALTVGCPIVAFGAPAGHAPTLARTMARLGVAVHAPRRRHLRPALLGANPGQALAPAPVAAGEILALTARAPVGRRQRLAVEAAATAAAVGASVLAVGAVARSVDADGRHAHSPLPVLVGHVVSGDSSAAGR